jgi:hypothetical protein
VVRDKEFPRGLGKNNSFSALKYFYIKNFQNIAGKKQQAGRVFQAIPNNI